MKAGGDTWGGLLEGCMHIHITWYSLLSGVHQTACHSTNTMLHEQTTA